MDKLNYGSINNKWKNRDYPNLKKYITNLENTLKTIFVQFYNNLVTYHYRDRCS